MSKLVQTCSNLSKILSLRSITTEYSMQDQREAVKNLAYKQRGNNQNFKLNQCFKSVCPNGLIDKKSDSIAECCYFNVIVPLCDGRLAFYRGYFFMNGNKIKLYLCSTLCVTKQSDTLNQNGAQSYLSIDFKNLAGPQESMKI